MEAQFKALDAQMQHMVFNAKTMNLGDAQRRLSDLGTNYANLAAATGKWSTIQKRVNDQTSEYTENLIKQKTAMKDITAARKSGLSQLAFEEQLRLRSARVSTLSRTASGEHQAQMMIPAQADKQFDTLSNRVGFAASELRSASTQMVNFGKNTQWAGRQLTVGFTVPLLAAGAATGYLANQADTNLTRIAKVYDTVNRDNLSAADQEIAKNRELAQLRSDAFTTGKNAAKQYGASLNDTLSTQGELAAAGIRGRQLQEATNETMRLATLGEMDYQTAVQATISLQSVFNQNSQELTKTFNFMNAVENQTSLSMQDFAQAIPVAAAPIKALGGDMKDLAILMVAMKARGIDAAEGANAIKSAFNRLLNPGKSVQELFTNLTGDNIQDIIKETKGELIPTLRAVGESVEGLQDFQKAQVLGKLFGTYQNTRINAMLTGITEDMTDMNSQVGRTIELTKKNDAALAGIADTELARAQASASGRLKRAVETIKVQLAEIGQGFLEAAVKIVEKGSDLIDFFERLPGPLKEILKWGTILVAGTGPLVMLAGLAANMAGTFLKAGSASVMWATRFKLLNKESVIAQGAQKLTETSMSRSIKTTESLTLAVSELSAAFAAATAQSGLMNQSLNRGKVTPGTIGMPQAIGGYDTQAIARSYQIEKDMVRNRKKNIDQMVRDEMQAKKIVETNGRFYDASSGKKVRISAAEKARREQEMRGAANQTYNADIAKQQQFRSDRGVTGRVQALRGDREERLRIAAAERSETEKSVKASQLAAAADRKRAIALNTARVGAGLLTASMIASLIPLGEAGSKTEEIKNNMATWGMAAGLLLPALAGIGPALVGIRAASAGIGTTLSTKGKAGITALTTGFAKSNTGATGLLGKTKSVGRYMLSAGGLMNPWIAGIAAAGAGAFLLWKHLKKAGDETRKINEDTASLGDIFGFVPREEGSSVDKKGNVIKDANTQLREFNAAYPAFAEKMRDAGSAWERENLALQQGFKAFDAGATVDQAKRVIETALRAGGETARDAKAITLKMDFNPDDIEKRMRVTMQKLQDSVNDSKKNRLNPFGDYGKSDAGAAGKSAGKTVSTLIDSGNVSAAAEQQARILEALNEKLKTMGYADGAEVAENFMKAYAKQLGKDADGAGDIIQEALFGDIDVDQARKTGAAGLFDEKTLAKFSPDMAAYLKQQQEAAKLQKVITNLRGLEKNEVSDLSTYLMATNGQQIAALQAAQAGKKLSAEQKAIIMEIEQATGIRILGENGVLSVLRQQTNELSKQSNTDRDIQQAHSKKLVSALQADLNGLDAVYEKRNQNLEASHTAQMNGLEAAQRRREAAFDAQADRMENRHNKEQHNFDKRWDARIKRVKDEEDLRQRIFDAERNRIKRLADLQNANINFNAALQRGDLDEAARVQNTQRADTETNNLDDLDSKLGNKADKSIASLERQRDAAQYKLKRHQDFEKQAFEATKRRYADSVAAAKAAADAGYQAQKAALEREKTARKNNLTAAITDLQNYKFKSMKEWLAHLKQVREKFHLYGGASGRVFGDEAQRILMAKIRAGIKAAGKDKDNKEAGNKSAQGWFSGAGSALGLSRKELAKFARNHWSTGKGGQGGLTVNHGGGPLDKQSNNRKGYSPRQARAHSEVNVLAKKSEYMLQTSARRKYGDDLLDAVNRGQAEIIRHAGGPVGYAKGSADANRLRMETVTKNLAIARAKQVKAAREAEGAGVSGGSWKGAAKSGWQKPWKGSYSTSNGHDYPLVYKSLYAPHDGTVGTTALRGHESRVSHGGHGYKSYGKYVDFNGGGIRLMFAHLSKLPKEGKVKRGQYMGTTGETGNAHGPHVHVEVNRSGNNGRFGQFFKSRGIGLRKGGTVKYDNTMANLHHDETVLTKGLTEKFKEGVEGFAEGGSTVYDVDVTIAGSASASDADAIANAVIKKLELRESRKGRKRK